MQNEIFDVTKFSFGIPEIETHMHRHVGARIETIEGQARLLKKWINWRDKLHADTRLDPEQIQERQLQQVSALVDAAYIRHPYYHETFKQAGFRPGDVVTWDDYAALPTLSKNQVIDNYDLFATALGPDATHIYTQRTSGASGRTIQTMRDPTMTDWHALWELRFMDQMLDRPRAPSEWCYMSYLACPPYTSLLGQYPFFTVSNNCPEDAVVKHLKLLKPAILSVFPSTLTRIAALVDDPAELGIKAILVNSETSTVEERSLLGRKMGAPVFNEYSSVELSYLGTECRNNHLHITEDNVRVDVLNPNDEGLGEIVATNLVSGYMPMIRYLQGDIIKIGDHSYPCKCGSRFRHYEKFMGRADEFLYSRTAGLVAPDRLMELYDSSLIEARGIVEFQIVQVQQDKVELNIVPSSTFGRPDEASIDRFKHGLRSLFQDAGLEVVTQKMAEIPRGLTHKRRIIINAMPRV